ncbi:MAG: TIGR01777 family oxidoreductase [Acidimicrobiia bacterium]
MKVAITGASGMIGRALSSRLTSEGHEVIAVVRRTAAAGEVWWDPVRGEMDARGLEGVDAVVHLAGAGIGDKRWNAAYKEELLESRVKGTELLARTLPALDRPPAVLLSASAIGFYGDRGDEVLTETSGPGKGFLADLCQAWEHAAEPVAEAGIRTVYLRTGIVLSAAGGALKKQLPLFKFGLGGKMGSGRQWMSWIALDDEVGAIVHLLTSSLSGPVNLVAPNAVTNGEFTATLASVLHRPAVLPIPPFGPKLLLGSEMAEHLLFYSQHVRAQRLEEDGFRFAHPALRDALEVSVRRAS